MYRQLDRRDRYHRAGNACRTGPAPPSRWLIPLFLFAVTVPVEAQQTAIGATLGAKAAGVFGWGRGGARDGILRVIYAEQTPWADGDKRIVELSFLVGLARRSGDVGWVRAALGPSWVIHGSSDGAKGGQAWGLAGQLDAAASIGRLSNSALAVGLIGMADVNTRASFFSLGVALHVLR